MGHTRGEPNEIEVTAAQGLFCRSLSDVGSARQRDIQTPLQQSDDCSYPGPYRAVDGVSIFLDFTEGRWPLLAYYRSLYTPSILPLASSLKTEGRWALSLPTAPSILPLASCHSLEPPFRFLPLPLYACRRPLRVGGPCLFLPLPLYACLPTTPSIRVVPPASSHRLHRAVPRQPHVLAQKHQGGGVLLAPRLP